ncbi:unnamed protein product [Urochloa decumbens]|uniref:Uncharacterized protein n=1 Tax=Urochloa decumbens TaxID=240449 RepID=A0ABC9DAL5_9POAL
MADLVMGAMSSIMPKLCQLLEEEYNLQTRVKERIRSLMLELELVQAALGKVAEVPWDQLDKQVQIWARHVREASYDMEDVLDTFLMRINGPESDEEKKSLRKHLKKMTNFFKESKARRKISGDVKNIMTHVNEMTEQCCRYKVGDIGTRATTTSTIDPRLHAMYTQVNKLVGMDKSSGELMSMLQTNPQQGHASGMKMKIVSIVGVGGLGKTTLAKAVYDKIRGDFNCAAFVPVGRNPDLKKIFKDILNDLDDKDPNLHTLDERQLIDRLRKFFLESKKRIYGDDEERHVDSQPDEISDKFIRKCGGIPLAIITMASLLAGKPRYKWSELYNTIDFGSKNNKEAENTMKILSFSYYDLPSHLRTCLLYLSAFPEDLVIDKGSLVWKWIAEGFVQENVGISLFDTGEQYFNDLINKSMIQAEFDSDDITVIIGCRVHDVVFSVEGMTSIEELEMTAWCDEPRRRLVKNLGCLRELRVLSASILYDDETERDLVESLRHLHKLQSLNIRRNSFSIYDSTWQATELVLPCHLHHLSLSSICLCKLPSCINPSCLPNISHLELCLKAMDEQDLKTLGALLELRFLDLNILSSSAAISNINDSGASCYFPKLRRFRIWQAMVLFVANKDSVSFHIWNGEDDIAVMPFVSDDDEESERPTVVSAFSDDELKSEFDELQPPIMPTRPHDHELKNIPLQRRSILQHGNVAVAAVAYYLLAFFHLVLSFLTKHQQPLKKLGQRPSISNRGSAPTLNGEDQRNDSICSKGRAAPSCFMPSLQVLQFQVRGRALKDHRYCERLGWEYLSLLQEINVIGVYSWGVCKNNKVEEVLSRAARVHPNRPTLRLERTP